MQTSFQISTRRFLRELDLEEAFLPELKELALDHMNEDIESDEDDEDDDDDDYIKYWPYNHRDRLDTVIEYGNKISCMLYEKLPSEDQSNGRLVFANTRQHRPIGHPTPTEATPEVTVFFEGYQDKHGAPYWSHLESLSEVYTSGKDLPKRMDRCDVAHTGHLLEARPDRICVVTIHIGKRGISFLLADATGCRRTPVIEDKKVVSLLFIAYVVRLYTPPAQWFDPTIEPAGPSDEHGGARLFYVDLASAPSLNIRPIYRIMHVGDPFHRRSTVFRNVDSPVIIDGHQVDIIKEQYVPFDRRFQETEIIDHIHKDGTVPGVVGMICHEDVLDEDGKPIELALSFSRKVRRTYKKVRIAQCDMGMPLADVPTLWEFLIGIYDLLEVLRFLYFKRNILHCDISKGNVMYKPKPENGTPKPPVKPSNIPRSEICCARYLLGEEKEDWTAVTSSLIDFDHGEILNAKGNEPCLSGAGTGMFMSRAVVGGGPIPTHPWGIAFLGMPDAPNDTYRDIFPDRMAKFLPVDPKSFTSFKKEETFGPLRMWQRDLCHDAESVFWLILYWALYALPVGSEDQRIDYTTWTILAKTQVRDRRWTIFDAHGSADRFKYEIHPDYAPVAELVWDLWDQIFGDHYWAPSGPFCEPDYVHETFQRIILSFLIRHKGEEFLTKAKQEKRRSEEPWYYDRVPEVQKSTTGDLSGNLRPPDSSRALDAHVSKPPQRKIPQRKSLKRGASSAAPQASSLRKSKRQKNSDTPDAPKPLQRSKRQKKCDMPDASKPLRRSNRLKKCDPPDASNPLRRSKRLMR